MTEMSFQWFLGSKKALRLIELNQQNFLVSFMIHVHFMMICVIGRMISSIYNESKRDGKDQESIQ